MGWAKSMQCLCHMGDLTIIWSSSSLAYLSPKPTSKSTLLRDSVVLNVLQGRPPTVVFPGQVSIYGPRGDLQLCSQGRSPVVFPGQVSSCGSKGGLQLWPQGRTPGVLPEEVSSCGPRWGLPVCSQRRPPSWTLEGTNPVDTLVLNFPPAKEMCENKCVL